MKQNDPEQLMTTAEVSALVRLEPRTIHRKTLQGKFPEPIGRGRLMRFRRSEILRYIAAGMDWPDAKELQRREDADDGGPSHAA